MARKKNPVTAAAAHIEQLTQHWNAIAKLVGGATPRQKQKIDEMVVAWGSCIGFTPTSTYEELLEQKLAPSLTSKETPKGLRWRLSREMKASGMQWKEILACLRQSHPELVKGVTVKTLQNHASLPDPDECELVKGLRSCIDDNTDAQW